MKIIERIIFKTLITIILTILTLIIIKQNPKYKQDIYNQIYDNSITFSKINQTYKKYFGGPIPFLDFIDNDQKVFNENLEYTEINKYIDGAKLTVANEYLIPSQTEGIVIYIGEKENYGKTIIVQDSRGIDYWYGNLTDTSVKLYDYVKSGAYLGVCSNELYLVYKKDGEILNYNDFI